MIDLEQLTYANKTVINALRAKGLSVEDLATMTVPEVCALKGIGKVTAEKLIPEAQKLVNEAGLEEAVLEDLAYYYDKTPPWKILEDWAEDGLITDDVALATAGGLATLKNISEDLALALISQAQKIINEAGLYKARQSFAPEVPLKTTSAAFPIEWLSGEESPPPMSVRVQAIFDLAQQAYNEGQAP